MQRLSLEDLDRVDRVSRKCYAVTHRLRQSGQGTDFTSAYSADTPDNYVALASAYRGDFTRVLRSSNATELYPGLSKAENKRRQQVMNFLAYRNGVTGGFSVCGRAISIGLATIKSVSDTQPSAISAQEAGDIMTHERTIGDFVLFLARMPNKQNIIWEENLALTHTGHNAYMSSGDSPLTVVTDINDRRYLAPKGIVRVNAAREMINAGITPSDRQCPAQAMIAMMWPDMVQECVDDPRLFATDLAQAA